MVNVGHTVQDQSHILPRQASESVMVSLLRSVRHLLPQSRKSVIGDYAYRNRIGDF